MRAPVEYEICLAPASVGAPAPWPEDALLGTDLSLLALVSPMASSASVPRGE